MKHAYLIMAHNNFSVLKVLLKLLDDDRNDIYLHIDKSAKDWDDASWHTLLDRAQLHIVNRVKVDWATYSHLYAMKNLLLEATKTYHSHYHMISGADLPIKNQNQIHTFFNNHSNREFVGFAPSYREDIVLRHNYFVKFYRNSNKHVILLAKKCNSLLVKIQKKIGINVFKNYKSEIKKGHDWFSVTHAAALFLIQEEPKFKKYFYWAFCPSEFFAQTILFNSKFKNNIFDHNNENNGAQRCIDWNRGSPYTFKSEDIDILKESSMMFARKFIETEDMEIVNKLFHHLDAGDQNEIHVVQAKKRATLPNELAVSEVL